MNALPRPAAFLDRDGVINVDSGYVGHAAQFEWLPEVPQALLQLQAAGYALVVITNQSGIARGLYSEADFAALTQYMRAELADHGVKLDAVYYCPHHPEATIAAYRQHCDCRKPQAGMLKRAIDELHLDPARSCLFGDKDSDIAAGQSAGIARCWLVGSPTDPIRAIATKIERIAPNLARAVECELAASKPSP